jgi:hypothetical protein
MPNPKNRRTKIPKAQRANPTKQRTHKGQNDPYPRNIIPERAKQAKHGVVVVERKELVVVVVAMAMEMVMVMAVRREVVMVVQRVIRLLEGGATPAPHPRE